MHTIKCLSINAAFSFFSMGKQKKSSWCINSRRSSMRKFSICHYGGAGINLRRLPRHGRHFRRRRSIAAGSKLLQLFAASAAAPGKAAIPARLQLGGCRLAAAFPLTTLSPSPVKAGWGALFFICKSNRCALKRVCHELHN